MPAPRPASRRSRARAAAGQAAGRDHSEDDAGTEARTRPGPGSRSRRVTPAAPANLLTGLAVAPAVLTPAAENAGTTITVAFTLGVKAS